MPQPHPTPISRLSRWAALIGIVAALGGVRGVADDTHFIQAKADQAGDPLPSGAKARMGTLRWRHPDEVALVGFNPDGKRVVTVTTDSVVRIWERETGKELRRIDPNAALPRIAGRPGVVRYGYRGMSRTAVSRDGKMLATVLNANAIQLWDLQTGKELRQLKAPVGFVTMLLFSPDGKMLAARSSARVTSLLETEKGKVLHQIKGRPQVGAIAIVGIQGNSTSVGMAFSPDGKTLASAELDYANQKINTYIKFTDTQTGKEIRMIDGTPNGVFGMTYSPDGKSFAFGNFNAINLVTADALKEIHKIKVPQGVAGLTFSPDGKSVAAKGRDSVVRLFDASTGNLNREFGEVPASPLVNGVASSYYGADTHDFAFSTDSKLVAISSGQTLRFFDSATGKEQSIGGGHRGAVSAVTIAPDGKILFSRGADGVIRRWNAATGQELGQFVEPRGTLGAAFSPDGMTVALPNINGTIRLHATGDGKELHKAKGHQNSVAALAFSPDGKTLASRGTYDGVIRFCDVAKGTELKQILLPGANPNPNGALVIRSVYSGGNTQLAFSPDGQTLATTMTGTNLVMIGGQPRQTMGSTLHFFDFKTGKEINKITLPAGRAVTGLAFSPDGRLLATENNDQSLSVWELASGRERAILKHPAAAKQPNQPANSVFVGGGFGGVGRAGGMSSITLAFAPDGSLLAARDENDIRVWQVDAAKEIGLFKGHQGPVQTVAFAADGQSLATGSSDTTILVWDIAALKREPKGQPVELSADQLKSLYADLVADDALKAGQSIHTLIGSASTPAFLSEHLRPAAPPDVKKIAQWIKDLDSSTFKKRALATQELQKLGELAGPALTNALESQPAVEMRRRIEPLLANLASGTLSAEQIRMIRAVEVLEKLGTPEARRLLQLLAQGAPGALQTRKAQQALATLAKHQDR